MSVYNADKYLQEAVDSVLNQTYQDFEFIIINDCSKDKSAEILRNYEKIHKKIILIDNVDNLGLTRNLNLALTIAKGKYIARMDADDVCEPTRFEKQRAYLKKHKNVDIIGSFSTNINQDGEITGNRTVPVTHNDIMLLLPKLCPMTHPTVMFRKSSLKKLCNYNIKYNTSQDYDMWFRAASAGLKFHNLPEYLLKYRMDGKYVGRKTFKFRWNDFKLRLEGYKRLKLSLYDYRYALIPLALGILPKSLYSTLKMLDPR